MIVFCYVLPASNKARDDDDDDDDDDKSCFCSAVRSWLQRRWKQVMSLTVSCIRTTEQDVFSRDLNVPSESLCLTVFGKAFQLCGVESEKHAWLNWLPVNF